MISDEQMPEAPTAAMTSDEPVHALDQMLRRALRVGPAATTAGADSDTWAAAAPVGTDFWGETPPRPRRMRVAPTLVLRRALHGRARAVAASALVAALAVGWLATSRLGDAPGRRATRLPAAVASGGGVPNRSNRAHPVSVTTDADRALRASVPVGALCAYGPRSASEAHCSIGGVDVEYRLTGSAALAAGYRAAIGVKPGPASPASGGPRCARGGEEERSWSRPAAPHRAVGRYACRIEQGRAAMWWTVDDRGLLAHAIRSGGDLASLFAWWDSHAER